MSQLVLFFLFKQKPAYDVRISDWSSDVCSSDLPFTWILGAYYFHEKGSRESSYRGSRYDIIGNANNRPYGFVTGGNITSESYATFGQATFRPTDSLSFTGGIRYTHDEKRGNNYGFQFAPPAYDGPVEGSWQRVTYRLAADYQFTPDVLAYVSYSTGYNSGGVNQAINPKIGRASCRERVGQSV